MSANAMAIRAHDITLLCFCNDVGCSMTNAFSEIEFLFASNVVEVHCARRKLNPTVHAWLRFQRLHECTFNSTYLP